jgi:hypothetical protein
VTNNLYRTRYVGEVLRFVNKKRVAYHESTDATEVMCQVVTCYPLLPTFLP